MPVTGSQNRLPRPAKTQTIHGLVRAGDLTGVQRKLRENPALLNDKNPVVRASCAPPILSSRRRISLAWANTECAQDRIQRCLLFPYSQNERSVKLREDEPGASEGEGQVQDVRECLVLL
ncbi:uncharacterized protein LOC124671318 [Lolium rigidum]|uniref:uncharacterized protein LOC124671318 n=1 Tax=Lolium rigidum TaxID=89674 RepID=UPI001F5C4A5C|nr:uncharacterized protein LOC124671318 [Lolium rigidum]